MDQRAHDRQLQGESSPAAASPLAQHDDVLSPAQALRDSSASAVGGQRVGNSGPVGNPITTFADEDEPASEQPE